MLALANAQASEGDKPAAIKSAEFAADLALSNNQHLCIQVARQIEKVLTRTWRAYDQTRCSYETAVRVPGTAYSAERCHERF